MEDITNQVQLDEALDKWEADYQPITNHLVPDSSWSGWMFETYGKELEFVLSQPENHIWTWTDSDEGTFLSSGYHLVNRLGYFITEKPWTDSCLVLQVDCYAEFCDE